MTDFTELCVFSSLKQLAVDIAHVWSTYVGYKVAASVIRGAPLLELLEIVVSTSESPFSGQHLHQTCLKEGKWFVS